MQLQKFLRPLQKEADSLVKSFLSENPELAKKYVDSGVSVIGAILEPLSSFMRHLLVVRGLDPDSIPGARERAALQNLFESTHDSSFDPDFNFEFVNKKFEQTRQQLKHLDLDKEKFLGLTDISKLPSISDSHGLPVTIDNTVNQIAPDTDKRETRIRATDQERENQEVFDIGSNAIEVLRQAVSNIEKEIGVKATAKKKSGLKTTKKKLNKKVGTKVNRVNTPGPIPGYVDKKAALHDRLKAKLERCKKLVDDMVLADLIGNNPDDMKEQLEQVLLFNDDALNALERVVARHAKTPQDTFDGPFRRVTK